MNCLAWGASAWQDEAACLPFYSHPTTCSKGRWRKGFPRWKLLPAAELNQAGTNPGSGGAARICRDTVAVQVGRTALRWG